MPQNDNLQDLKRERRSLLGKLDRRLTAILFAERDCRLMRSRIRQIEEELRERGELRVRRPKQ